MRLAVRSALVMAAAVAVTALAPPLAGAGAATLSCGQSVSADVRLTRDLTGCAGDGLVVTAPGVRVDLAGHRITGRGSGAGIALEAPGATVTGGTVSGFVDGIAVRPGGGGTVSCMRLAGNVDGLFREPGGGDHPDLLVRDSRLVGNSGNGLTLTRGATTVRDSRISRNLGYGIQAFEADDAVYERNRVNRNGLDGMRVRDATARIVGNRASRNGGGGIVVIDDYPALYPYFLKDNTANRNAALGIALYLDVTGPGIDGGGNRARGNGDARECLGITCSR